MGSSRGQDRSLGTSGMSFPQWMKGRADSRYDFDQSSFSPPSHDDNFFCIRYSAKSSSTDTTENLASCIQPDGYRPISQVLSGNTNSSVSIGQVNVPTPPPPPSSSSSSSSSSSAAAASASASSTNISDIKEIKNIDFSKHPLPCQPFVPAASGGKAIKQKTTTTAGVPISKTKAAKSQGTDDGFHSGASLCGKSIVYVANRIMSGKLMKIDTVNEATETNKFSSMVQRSDTSNEREEQFLRKGSKSLPVSPIASPISTPDTSPKSRRRTNANRYFTIPERDKYQTGWILSSILGQSRDLIGGNNKLEEVEEEESPSAALDFLPTKSLSRKKSISSQNLSYLGRTESRAVPPSSQQQQQREQDVFQAKPSELREMNFWSPTSM